MNTLKQGIFISLILLSFNVNAQVDTSKLPKESTIILSELHEAVFPGGDLAWYKFLSKHLNNHVPTEKGAPAGSYKIKVEFWIDTTGSVTNVKALTIFGFGMEDQLIRAINNSGLWIPATYQGRLVKAKKLQVIDFSVEK